jgi:hypothetical protein
MEITPAIELAGFLEGNPDVPAPACTGLLVFPPGVSDDEKKRETDVIASLIGSGTMTASSYRHHQTSRRFGPVEFHAATIPANGNKEQWK